jgi:hypothetical protein
MDYFTTLGSKVQALYEDDQNPVAWYPAVIDRVMTVDDVTGIKLRYPKFVVTFTEYGNTEIVSLGELDVPGTNLAATGQRRLNSRGGAHHADHKGGKYESDRRFNPSDSRGYGGSHQRGRGYDRPFCLITGLPFDRHIIVHRRFRGCVGI